MEGMLSQLDGEPSWSSSGTQEKGRRKGRSIIATQKTKRSPKRSPSIVSTASTAITSDSELDSERPSSRDGLVASKTYAHGMEGKRNEK